MEWNAKSLGQWDWEHLFFFNTKATENPRLPTTDCSNEADREINVGVFYPSGGSACSGSELVHASSPRSSKSASNNSLSNEDSKASVLTLEGSQDDSTGKKELCPVETSQSAVPSPVSGEPLLTLKLGKRLYFEDVCAGSDSKKASSFEVPISSGKKYKTSNQNLQHPSCQVEGCDLDLSSAKDYHRKHRVCEGHSKSPKVLVAGLERRFCQQCSRFHALSEFDDKKRSCRKRLSDHNARRRKPQPDSVQLNPSALSSSPYDGRQMMSPFAFSRSATNMGWQNLHSNKLPQTKDFLPKPAKAFDKIPSIVSMFSDDNSGLLTSRSIAAKTIVPGLEDPNSISSCDPNGAQDVNRALSLLSSNSWGPYETKFLSLERSSRTQSMTHHQQRLPLASSSEYWHTDHQQQQPSPSTMSMCISFSDCDTNNRFQDFQLLSAPYDSPFPCNHLD
ncbi:squamosa promoter-binding-like protein 12 [Vigna umbellata]|uniref:squamosa promoter-binding-like protein 12 n=1 Tax=Vigna umbellata TaxID=87088 RepID=UPI001F5F50A0|nr:squamosa promoter-binding-like protein 12 [Vigna umbellata]XP_047159399.1 squamosa promoter-binding-like protein 12 [Vigna umbellata]XP_047159400.1 squamosa promoter-binding-like protein 12 [Vigna umbellata]